MVLFDSSNGFLRQAGVSLATGYYILQLIFDQTLYRVSNDKQLSLPFALSSDTFHLVNLKFDWRVPRGWLENARSTIVIHALITGAPSSTTLRKS